MTLLVGMAFVGPPNCAYQVSEKKEWLASARLGEPEMSRLLAKVRLRLRVKQHTAMLQVATGASCICAAPNKTNSRIFHL